MTDIVSDAHALASEDLRREYGSDCLRLYLLFMGPGRDYQREEAWDEDTMAGLFRYLGKVWRKWDVDGQDVPVSAYRNKKAGKALKRDTGEVFTSSYRRIINQTLQGRYHAGLTMLMSLLKRKTPDGAESDRQSYLRLLLPYAPCLSLTLLLQGLPSPELPEIKTCLADLWDADYAGPGKTKDGVSWIEIPMQYNGKLFGHIWIRDNAGEEEVAAEAAGMLVRKAAEMPAPGTVEMPALGTAEMPAPEEYMDHIPIAAEGEGIYRIGRKRYTVYYIPGRIINICDK